MPIYYLFPHFMRYVMNYTGCGVPVMENRTKVYVINMLQFYKILIIRERSVLIAMQYAVRKTLIVVSSATAEIFWIPSSIRFNCASSCIFAAVLCPSHSTCVLTLIRRLKNNYLLKQSYATYSNTASYIVYFDMFR
jgi:hypothetical protein